MALKKNDLFNLQHQQILKNIKTKREELNISQLKMASLMHMSDQGYIKIEKGKSSMNTIRLFQISKILKIDPRELIGCPIKKQS